MAPRNNFFDFPGKMLSITAIQDGQVDTNIEAEARTMRIKQPIGSKNQYGNLLI